MKRFFIISVLLLSCATVFAQWEDIEPWNVVEPETVKSGHKTQWYEDQACAWQKVVNADPKNETAWRNLFRASYLYEYYRVGIYRHSYESPMTDGVLRKMKAAIPNSYVFYLSLCQDWLSELGEFDPNMLLKTLSSVSKDISAQELKPLIFRLWRYDPENIYLEGFFRTIYAKRYYSERIMRYGWNLMQSMQKDAIYVARSWYQYEQILMMQYIFDERKDIMVISYNDILSDDKYRKDICKRLKLLPFVAAKYNYDENERVASDFIKYLKKRCDRPFYLSLDLGYKANIDKAWLYNEGLLLRYSEKQYDNILVALHNIKEVYDLNYLIQPMFMYEPDGSSQYVDNNVVYSLINLAEKFEELGYKEDSKRLHEFLGKVYDRNGSYYDHYIRRTIFDK